MRLDEIIKLRIDSLYTELHDINTLISTEEQKSVDLKKDIDLLRKFIMVVNRNSEGIRKFSEEELESITDILIKYWDFSYDKEEVKNMLKLINLVLIGKCDNNIMMDLSTEQRSFLNAYLNASNKCLELMTNKYKNRDNGDDSLRKIYSKKEDEILNLEILFEKIKDPNDTDLLTEEDCALVEKIANDENVSINIRKQMLALFIKYNYDRTNGVSKEISKVDFNEVVRCFEDAGFGPAIIEILGKHKDEIINNANIANIRDILSYLKEIDIIYRFEKIDLIDICVYGTLESVKRTYEMIKNDPSKLSLYTSLTPSVWINNTERKTSVRNRRPKDGGGHGGPFKTPLYLKAHQISSEEVEENIRFLQSKGFNVSFDNPQCKKTIITPNYRLRFAYDVYKEYGVLGEDNVDSFAVSALSASFIADRLDNFIEVGLLHGSLSVGEEYRNYLRYNASKILYNYDDLFPLLALSYRDNEAPFYYELFFSKNHKGKMNATMLSDMLTNDSLMGQSKRIKEDNTKFIETYIPHHEEFEKIIINDSDISYDESILNDPEIISLEDNNRVEGNDKVYIFGNQTISRMKVLRNYSKLRNENTNNEEALMYSIVRGSYLDEKTFKEIATQINYGDVLGGNHGIPGGL